MGEPPRTCSTHTAIAIYGGDNFHMMPAAPNSSGPDVGTGARKAQPLGRPPKASVGETDHAHGDAAAGAAEAGRCAAAATPGIMATVMYVAMPIIVMLTGGYRGQSDDTAKQTEDQ